MHKMPPLAVACPSPVARQSTGSAMMRTTTRCANASSHRLSSNSSAAIASNPITRPSIAVFHSIEGFYNPSRRRSALGILSTIEYKSRSRPPGRAGVSRRTSTEPGQLRLCHPLGLPRHGRRGTSSHAAGWMSSEPHRRARRSHHGLDRPRAGPDAGRDRREARRGCRLPAAAERGARFLQAPRRDAQKRRPTPPSRTGRTQRAGDTPGSTARRTSTPTASSSSTKVAPPPRRPAFTAARSEASAARRPSRTGTGRRRPSSEGSRSAASSRR